MLNIKNTPKTWRHYFIKTCSFELFDVIKFNVVKGFV